MKGLLSLVVLLSVLCSCKQEKKYHDQIPGTTLRVTNESLQDILDFQQQLNEEYKNPKTSPLPDRFRKNFEALSFYAPNADYRVTAHLERNTNLTPFLMPTTTDRVVEEVVFGTLTFELKGHPYQLEVYQNPELMKKEGYEDYLFLPFLDKTNGIDTYEGGRYLDLKIPLHDSIQIDFNKAYNPYCAYNKKYSCPIVPKSNMLDTHILAGVKAFESE